MIKSLFSEIVFDIIFMDTFELHQMLSLSIIRRYKKGGDIYDKKRSFSIYCNITTIPSCNYFTPKIVKASDFTTK